jgi:nicotinate-nucleotide pyrophosphorylase (carboxylating)
VLGIEDAVRLAHERWPGRTVHVECESLDQVEQALRAGADALLLDNMSPDEVAECVRVVGRRAIVEVSGGITLDTVGAYAETGADLISVGSITHSAPVLDIGLDIRMRD